MIIQIGAKFVEISAPRKISDFVYTTGEPLWTSRRASLDY